MDLALEQVATFATLTCFLIQCVLELFLKLVKSRKTECANIFSNHANLIQAKWDVLRTFGTFRGAFGERR